MSNNDDFSNYTTDEFKIMMKDTVEQFVNKKDLEGSWDMPGKRESTRALLFGIRYMTDAQIRTFAKLLGVDMHSIPSDDRSKMALKLVHTVVERIYAPHRYAGSRAPLWTIIVFLFAVSFFFQFRIANYFKDTKAANNRQAVESMLIIFQLISVSFFAYEGSNLYSHYSQSENIRRMMAKLMKKYMTFSSK